MQSGGNQLVCLLENYVWSGGLLKLFLRYSLVKMMMPENGRMKEVEQQTGNTSINALHLPGQDKYPVLIVSWDEG